MNITKSTDKEYYYIANAITKFNLDNLPPNSGVMQSFGYVAKDDDNILLGGVYGRFVLGKCLSIEVLWVEEKYRGNMYATELMHVIENAAKELGSHLSIVDTFDFQALDFYLKCGYELFGTLEDCPSVGHKRYYLSKKL